MVGGFNIHISDVSCSFADDFLCVTESFNFIQHVSGPTPIRGQTLDLVFTLGLNIDCLCLEELRVTDHKCVLFLSFNLDSVPGKPADRSRIINRLLAEKFSAAFLSTLMLIVWSTALTHIALLFWRKWLLVK